jgi:glucose-6-phosphate isomerase
MTPADAYARFPAVREALDELTGLDAARRLHARDASLWTDDADTRQAIEDRLGWLDVAGGQPPWDEALPTFAETVADDGIDRVVVAGMGGSSLAPEVYSSVFADAGQMSVEVLDSTHPDAVTEVLPEDLSSTLVVVSSKSGTTEETRAFALRAERLVPSTRHLVAITDPDTRLATEAHDRAWRSVFVNPADIGGRYSALSLFGMVPAALAGVDVRALWRSGGGMLASCDADHHGVDNPALALAAFMGGLARSGRDKLTVLTSSHVRAFGDWLEQLVAESTGKQGRGVVPVVGEPVGPPDVYGDDRAFVVLELADDPVPGVDALEDAGFPVLTLRLDDRLALGGEFVRWEAATALTGVLLGVNPFDEPNVSESKQNTAEMLDQAADGDLPEPEHGDLAALLDGVVPGDYISLQAYLPRGQKISDGLTELRVVLRDNLGVATTAGYGPRFLHSTGQLHKGGPASVVVVQLADVPGTEVPIPDRPYDFGTLVRAQALGDLRSLRAHDRRVVQRRVDGPPDLVRLIGDVTAALHKPRTGSERGDPSGA